MTLESVVNAGVHVGVVVVVGPRGQCHDRDRGLRYLGHVVGAVVGAAAGVDVGGDDGVAIDASVR